MSVRSRRHSRFALAAFALCVGTLSPPANAARPGPPQAASPRAARGAGGWQRAGRAAQQWDIVVTRRDDTTIDGRVTLAGSPLLQRGVLHGILDGRHVSGSVSDDGGNQAATFVGVVTPKGTWEGTYEDRTGEVGRWTWNGQ